MIVNKNSNIESYFNIDMYTNYPISVCRNKYISFGEQFEKSYEQMHMTSDVEYYKVFYYTGDKAKVYYVDGSIHAGHFVWLKKKAGEWKMETWKTVWSEDGSARGITFLFYK